MAVTEVGKEGEITSERNWGTGNYGATIQERRTFLGEGLDWVGRGDPISTSPYAVQAEYGVGVASAYGRFSFSPGTGESSGATGGNLGIFSFGLATSSNPKDGTSLESLKFGLGVGVGAQGGILGMKVGGFATLDYGFVYDKTNGWSFGFTGNASGSLVTNEVEIDIRIRSKIKIDPRFAEAYNESGIMTYNAMGDFGPLYQEPNARSAPPPSNGPAGELKVVQTPSGPQVVNPGSTYVPPGSAPPPAPKPAIPPTVTWGPMASPGVPGGSGPVVKDKGNLQPTTRDAARDRQADQRPVGGGSGSGSSGGGASGGGSGGSGGTRSTGPS
ncbi:MAG: hypothetical protein IOC84_10935, partial [Rhodobacter sp.]|nr:hypothetical protein [Rhodobacter sp.]